MNPVDASTEFSLPRDAVERLVVEVGGGTVAGITPLAGGRNNRAYRVAGQGVSWFLKWYYAHPSDPRDRLGVEFAFCEFCRDQGVDVTPRPFAKDAAHGLGLYEFVDGTRVTRVRREHVAQALDFLAALNRGRGGQRAAALPMASEACFSLDEHLGRVDRRLARLENSLHESAAVGDAREFLRGRLLPSWRATRARRGPRRAVEYARGTSPGARTWCLSPSDFGFHNALVEPDGRIRFLDFEYAGWDDPAKLVGDFFSQVECPVPPDAWDDVVQRVGEEVATESEFARRARLLRPVYQFKWCCIVLNDFLPDGRMRREFGDTPSNTATRLPRQLRLARNLLDGIAEPD